MIPVLNTAMCLMSCFVKVAETGVLEIAHGGWVAPGSAPLTHPCVHTHTYICMLVCTPWQHLANTCVECQCVLVSAGTELTFFLVAGTVLCFGFSVRMMLITL